MAFQRAPTTPARTLPALAWALMAALAWPGATAPALAQGTTEVTRPSSREIVLTRAFIAPRQAVFDALTQADHLLRWMKPTRMSLVTCEVDLRAGGSFRYVFERPTGTRIEVRGAYLSVDPPRRFVYAESYDFSPLKLQVTTTLNQDGRLTVFRQKLVYASKQERDADFDGVATSAAEAYASLARYLESLPQGQP
jgi:uncharacterized protein YndB with AHSA1/START domain